MNTRGIASLLTAIVAISCATTPKPAPRAVGPATAPPVTSPEPLENPPLASAVAPAPFPAIQELKLDNGLAVDVVSREQYPLVEARLVLRAGTLSDGQQPGRASLAAELLKAGGAGKSDAHDLARRIENLVTSLDVETLADSTQLSLSVTSNNLDAAIGVLSDVVLRPRFDSVEADKLKQRRIERARTELLSDPDWEASLVLLRQLYGNHPYAHPEPLPSELEALSLSDCQSWYRTEVTPKNAVLVLVGDVQAERALALAKRAFSSWHGAQPTPPANAATKLPTNRKIWLIDRPGLAQSEIRVAGLGTRRNNPSWPAIAADNQILGGATAGRLFLNVREQLSLAYHTGSVLLERAQGRVPIVLAAGTRSEKTAEALQALLQQASALTSVPPETAEVEMATRYLTDSIAFQTETVTGVARLVAKLRVLDLPNSYYDEYAKRLLGLQAPQLFATTLQTIDFWSPVVVVVGDASRIEQSLRKFGPVAVLNPREELTTDHELSRL
jgi:predicted Zn-dependent peptidase